MLKFYYSLAPNPMKVALFLEEAGLPYEAIPVDTRKGEQHAPAFTALNPNAKVPVIVDGDEHRVRQQCDPALPGGEDRAVPARAAELRGADAVLADVRGLGHRAVHRPVRALQALRARAQPLRAQPLRLRGVAALEDPRRAPGATARGCSSERYTLLDMAVWGWARAVPFALGAEAWQQLPHVKRLFDAVNERPAAQRAAALKDRHAFKTEMDDEARRAMFPQNERLKG